MTRVDLLSGGAKAKRGQDARATAGGTDSKAKAKSKAADRNVRTTQSLAPHKQICCYFQYLLLGGAVMPSWRNLYFLCNEWVRCESDNFWLLTDLFQNGNRSRKVKSLRFSTEHAGGIERPVHIWKSTTMHFDDASWTGAVAGRGRPASTSACFYFSSPSAFRMAWSGTAGLPSSLVTTPKPPR